MTTGRLPYLIRLYVSSLYILNIYVVFKEESMPIFI